MTLTEQLNRQGPGTCTGALTQVDGAGGAVCQQSGTQLSRTPLPAGIESHVRDTVTAAESMAHDLGSAAPNGSLMSGTKGTRWPNLQTLRSTVEGVGSALGLSERCQAGDR
jgi:hypothetical protein